MKAEHCNGRRRYAAELKGSLARLTVDGKSVGFAKWDARHGLYDLPQSIPTDVVAKLEVGLRRPTLEEWQIEDSLEAEVVIGEPSWDALDIEAADAMGAEVK